ncbi:MAG: helix-turn-helix domain-containing protein [Oscillospiraceae bacterium]|nr:helix-turn-helix domain-containing protein [Oscillospiraceae bacterium]
MGTVMSLGEVLRNLMDERDITQKKLADNLNIGASTLGNYIQNIREPDFEMLQALATYFDVSTDYLLGHNVGCEESPHEGELIRIFRSLEPDQKELFIEQGKLFIIQNNKKSKLSQDKTTKP